MKYTTVRVVPLFLFMLSCLFGGQESVEAVPTTISYQGRITDSAGQVPPDTAHQMFFRLYRTSSGGSAVWSEVASITPSQGLFTHALGSQTHIPDSLLSAFAPMYLEVQIGAVTLAPRTLFESAAFARYSGGISLILPNGRGVFSASDSTSMFLANDSGRQLVTLTPDKQGDSAVTLADNAVSAGEVQDEPGIAVSIGITPITLVTAVMTDLITIEITAPAAGYVVLQGKCYVELRGTTGANIALVQIDFAEGGGSLFPYFSLAGLGGYVNSQSNYFPVHVSRVYFVDSGTYTFRMEGRAQNPPPAEAVSWDHVFVATYYPTAYDAVRSLSSVGDADSPIIRLKNQADDQGEGSIWYYEDLRDRASTKKRNVSDPTRR